MAVNKDYDGKINENSIKNEIRKAKAKERHKGNFSNKNNRFSQKKTHENFCAICFICFVEIHFRASSPRVKKSGIKHSRNEIRLYCFEGHNHSK